MGHNVDGAALLALDETRAYDELRVTSALARHRLLLHVAALRHLEGNPLLIGGGGAYSVFSGRAAAQQQQQRQQQHDCNKRSGHTSVQAASAPPPVLSPQRQYNDIGHSYIGGTMLSDAMSSPPSYTSVCNEGTPTDAHGDEGWSD